MIQPNHPDIELPPGNHPLEVAAREGIGPLSPLGRESWHGQASPCVSCGLLVRQNAEFCPHCSQDLSLGMLEKMRLHAGPWYVYEHVKPFPGVSLERILRQVQRGIITETSIIRGPATYHQWRYAVEVPGICRLFNRCWKCHGDVQENQTRCPLCLAYLLMDRQGAEGPVPAMRADEVASASVGRSSIKVGPKTHNEGGGVKHENPVQNETALKPRTEWEELKALVDTGIEGDVLARREAHLSSSTGVAVMRILWLPVTLLVVVLFALIWLTHFRNDQATPRHSTPIIENTSQAMDSGETTTSPANTPSDPTP